jgi:hypothetical protein
MHQCFEEQKQQSGADEAGHRRHEKRKKHLLGFSPIDPTPIMPPETNSEFIRPTP